MRTILLLVAFVLTFPAAASAAGPPVDRPRWSLEFKGGRFYPALDDWETYYGRDNTWHYAASLAYKVTRQIETGVEGGYSKDVGLANGSLSGTLTGRAVYQAAPLNVFVLFRAVFSERQWVVPYAGGGWTRMFYRETVEGQGTVRGSADGYHGRAGLQFLLDEVDRTAARNMRHDYSILHTYFFTEVARTKAKTDAPAIDIGGTSYLLGLLFEF